MPFIGNTPAAVPLTSADIADGIIVNADINASAAIALTKLASTGTLTVDNIQFPATQVASANANTLDDYEEGTFTPILTATSPGASGQVYSSRTALYTKIGRYVFCTVDIRLSTKGTFSGSNILLGDLPFTINANSNTGGGSCGYWVALATNWNSVFLFPIANTATMYITGAKSAVANSDFFASADIAATTEFRFVFSYIV
jgi:hypothetical protein